ncbi:MAG: hypothetical protein HY600_03290 [Candidatus Omnitrophica bacterium]|nr:hypothetical protein [Candidatus Omnitrophota bacterium]
MVIRLGFRAKLLGVVLGLLAFMTAGALLTVRHYFGDQLRQHAEREIRAGAHVLASILEQSGTRLIDRGRILAQLPSLQNALTKEPTQLEPLLQGAKTVRAANLLWATDPRGTVLASTGEYPPPGLDLSRDPLVAAAAAGEERLGFSRFAGDLWFHLALPVASREPAKPPLGTVNLAILLGEAYIARLGELMGTRVGLVIDGQALWSPGWPDEVGRQIVAHLQRGMPTGPQELPGATGRHVWMARAMSGLAVSLYNPPVGIIGSQLDDSVIRQTTRATAWIALLTMVVGALLSAWTIRPLLRRLETAQAQLLQSEKLASIGQLAAGVAHELNNPLMVMMGNAQLALRAIRKSEGVPEGLRAELAEALQIVDQEAHRSKTIVANLLDFSRIKPAAEAPTDLHALLDECLRLVEHQATLQSVQVERAYADGLPSIRVDPAQIKQVFVNVVLNAVQAMPKGGTLRLVTAAQDTTVQIDVSDTGVGIPKEALDKVFDPFFTTKEVGVGTGLGLSVSYGIIQHHGGTIALTSEVGRGTTVTVTLPRR